MFSKLTCRIQFHKRCNIPPPATENVQTFFLQKNQVGSRSLSWLWGVTCTHLCQYQIKMAANISVEMSVHPPTACTDHISDNSRILILKGGGGHIKHPLKGGGLSLRLKSQKYMKLHPPFIKLEGYVPSSIPHWAKRGCTFVSGPPPPPSHPEQTQNFFKASN